MIIVLVILCIVLNTISLTSNWIEEKTKELAIRKAFGGTDKKVAKRILLEYELVVTFSFLLGYIFSIIYIKNRSISIFGRNVYWLSSLISYLICLIIVVITAIIPMKKAMKLSVFEIMR